MSNFNLPSLKGSEHAMDTEGGIIIGMIIVLLL